MKLYVQSSKRRARSADSGQVIVEACMGLALMTLTWILVTYSLYMGNNHIRTAMAARYAAWYRGASGNEATPAQLDQGFYFQSGLAKVEYAPGEGIGDLLSANSSFSADATKFTSDAAGPFKARVTFGVTDLNSPTNPYPFNLLRTQAPFMPNSMLTNCFAVSAQCQWDEVGNTWSTPGQALEAIFDMLKGTFESLF